MHVCHCAAQIYFSKKETLNSRRRDGHSFFCPWILFLLILTLQLLNCWLVDQLKSPIILLRKKNDEKILIWLKEFNRQEIQTLHSRHTVQIDLHGEIVNYGSHKSGSFQRVRAHTCMFPYTEIHMESWCDPPFFSCNLLSPALAGNLQGEDRFLECLRPISRKNEKMISCNGRVRDYALRNLKLQFWSNINNGFRRGMTNS